MDRHRFDADPDPDSNFHVDTNPDPDTPDFAHVGKSEFSLLLITALLSFTMLYLSHQCQRCHNFKYFGQHTEIL